MNSAIHTIPADAVVGKLANMSLDPEFSIQFATEGTQPKLISVTLFYTSVHG